MMTMMRKHIHIKARFDEDRFAYIIKFPSQCENCDVERQIMVTVVIISHYHHHN